ncbi:MAG TPA: hypothetical protein VHL80_16905 [Polyangia bacterium]|nr:hypothetical protein [Polyangia bacterium]
MNTKSNGAALVAAPPERWRLVGPALRIAHVGPIAASVALVAIVLALTFGTWIPLAVGLPALLVFIQRCLVSPRLWRAAAEAEAVRAVELPASADFTDRTARALLERIIVARGELDDAIAACAAPRAAEVLIQLRSVRALERAAVATLHRVELLAGAPADAARVSFVVSEPDRGMPETTSLLERAAAARAERSETLRELNLRRQRELARLEYLTSCLEALPAALLELQVLDGDVLDGGLSDAVQDADVLRAELRHVRQAMGDRPADTL